MASTSPGGRVLELAQVLRDDSPAAGDGDRWVVQRPDERRHDVPGRLEARVEQDRDRAGRPAQADVRRRGVAESLARPDHLGRQAPTSGANRRRPAPLPARATGRRRRSRPRCRRARSPGARPAPGRGRPASRSRSGSRSPGRPAPPRASRGRSGWSRSGPDRPRRCPAARPGDRAKSVPRSAIFQPGRLDLAAQPIGRRPVPRLSRRRAGVGRRQHLVGDPLAGHAGVELSGARPAPGGERAGPGPS